MSACRLEFESDGNINVMNVDKAEAGEHVSYVLELLINGSVSLELQWTLVYFSPRTHGRK